MFVAEYKNNVIGFIAYKIIVKAHHRFSRACLGAVRFDFQRRGVYSALLSNGFNWGIDEKLANEGHFVLAQNKPINNLLMRKGFTLIGGFLTFHYWMDGE